MERWQPPHRRKGRSNDSRSSNASNHFTTTSKTTNLNGFETNNKQKQDANDPENLPNLIGTCPFMCPIEERSQRERLRDLAVFERLDGNPNKSSPSLAVKKFCRTISTTKNINLRPIPVLETTLNHLLNIFEDSLKYPFETVHEFVFDRTRSIRQDLCMQNITFGNRTLNIYERIVKFHIISHYKLQKDSPMHHLNMEQLTKTLSSLYHLYQENHKHKAGPTSENESEFYSFYVLLHLGSDHNPTGESLSLWFRRLPCSVLKSKEMMLTRKLLRYFRFGNYKRFLYTTEAEASCLQYYIIGPYISEMRAFGLSCLNHGGYKLHPYSISDISKYLLLEESDVESFCKDCGLDTFVGDDGTMFMPTKQTSFCYPKGYRKYYPLVSKRLKNCCDEVSCRI